MADPRAIVARFYEEVLNGKRLDLLAELAAPDFVGTPPITESRDPGQNT